MTPGRPWLKWNGWVRRGMEAESLHGPPNDPRHTDQRVVPAYRSRPLVIVLVRLGADDSQGLNETNGLAVAET